MWNNMFREGCSCIPLRGLQSPVVHLKLSMTIVMTFAISGCGCPCILCRISQINIHRSLIMRSSPQTVIVSCRDNSGDTPISIRIDHIRVGNIICIVNQIRDRVPNMNTT